MKDSTKWTNVVPKETLTEIQKYVLEDLSKTLKQSFGPMGSNSCIKKENALNVYTKDGHTILKNIYYHGIIEQSIKDDVESITRHIVTTVGDGTTSAVMMSSLIFNAINRYMEQTNLPPVEVTKRFNKAIDHIASIIRNKYSKECTLDDIYDITMIATNGDEFIAQTLKDIYESSGMGVFIDVAAASTEETSVKYFDGMTINTGYSDSCYITNATTNEAVIDNPRIYFFKDPIDTKEMAAMLDAIISKNIYVPYAKYAQGNKDAFNEIIPTVIVAPKISQDLSAIMKSISQVMSQMDPANRLPILIIDNYHQHDIMGDIATLCKGKFIHKYIDADIMQADIESGNCPTTETIQDFCGYCESVVATPARTSFINPCDMRDANGEFTLEYQNLVKFVETELTQAKNAGEDAHVIGTLKRRIHALKSNLVELNIGGITQADRDSLRDLVEDAVLNCRSAAANGVGYGANYTGYMASAECANEAGFEYADICRYIYNAYVNIIEELYSTATSDIDKLLEDMEKYGPYNIRTKQFDGKVKSSIESDIIVLETVGKIVGLMATCNQFIVPSPMHNVYEQDS